MAKVAREIVEKRPAEIIEACRKLYKVKSFKEISLKDISRETSLSRPSIYNYFQTKEEIFLAVLEDEYRLWNISLENILKNNIFYVILGHIDCDDEELYRASLLKRVW